MLAFAAGVVWLEAYREAAETRSASEQTEVSDRFQRRALVLLACLVLVVAAGVVWLLASRRRVNAPSASEVATKARMARRLLPCLVLAAVVGLVWFLASRPWVKPLPASEQARIRAPFERREPEATNSVGMKFRLIPGGQFMMGCEERGGAGEGPVHRVTIGEPFYLGVHEVTQAQYEEVMGSNPSGFRGPNRPVECVSWHDAQEFCRRLSVREGAEYRLPTEAEWEYACRAGSTTDYCFGDYYPSGLRYGDHPIDYSPSALDEYAWYRYNSGRGGPRQCWDTKARMWHVYVRGQRTHDVGQKKPNAWGLCDMHGNVREWCHDWCGPYTAEAQTDPKGPAERIDLLGRVARGGSWSSSALDCHSACRSAMDPARGSSSIGLRVARSLP
jgi:formylglycine-generating enzyme required for sulfatase activity